jgi:agmatinase
MYSGDVEKSCAALEKVVEEVSKSGAFPLVIGGDHTITWPNATGLARARGWGRLGVIHFDAHADTGNVTFGSLVGHGQPMRRLIESGAVRGDRFLQVGLRGYWPEAETLSWMATQGMRSFEMSEITTKGLANCLDEVIRIATDDCDGVFLSVDVDVVDPGSAPGTGTPEPGGLTSREVLDAVRKITLEAPVIGMDVVEVSPPYDHADITALLASRVALEALSALAKKKRGEQHDPAQPLLSNR